MTDSLNDLLKRSLSLLERYRNDVPLGHQPHMIAGEAEKVIVAIRQHEAKRQSAAPAETGILSNLCEAVEITLARLEELHPHERFPKLEVALRDARKQEHEPESRSRDDASNASPYNSSACNSLNQTALDAAYNAFPRLGIRSIDNLRERVAAAVLAYLNMLRQHEGLAESARDINVVHRTQTLIGKTLRTGVKGALVNLVELKRHKEAFGADEFYKANKDRAWEIARQAIEDDQSGEMLLLSGDKWKIRQRIVEALGKAIEKEPYNQNGDLDCMDRVMGVLEPYFNAPKQKLRDDIPLSVYKKVQRRINVEHGGEASAETITEIAFQDLQRNEEGS